MTQDEYAQLQEIVNDPQGWTCRSRLADAIQSFSVSDESPSKRTGAQNAALHLWFRQVADLCNQSGLDAKLLFSKTMDLEVQPETIKSLWHATQKAYYDKGSTTELSKSGEIEKIYDTLVRFFGERHNLELPPFPNDPHKNNIKLSAIENLKNENYPEMTEQNNANQF